MGFDRIRPDRVDTVPNWVPEAVQDYLAHTGAGVPIRDLARLKSCHASTISRRIRRIEGQRDDPLFDAALRRIEARLDPDCPELAETMKREILEMTKNLSSGAVPAAMQSFEKEALRVLRRLCETGAVLAAAVDMDTAVVLRESPDGRPTRTAVVAQEVAQDMAVKGWIETGSDGRLRRYTITQTGRDAVKSFLDRFPGSTEHSAQPGFADAVVPFTPAQRVWGERTVRDETGSARKVCYNLADSPLTALARRKDKTGGAFLAPGLVRCGERLREDFELAQMEDGSEMDWGGYLLGLSSADQLIPNAMRETLPSFGPMAARVRVLEALEALGPGLRDVAFRCCCLLEGLETCEAQMGWSARSGKIVLRIALQRLEQFYAETKSDASEMIG